MTAADRLQAHAITALVEAARAAGRHDTTAVTVWLAAADAAATMAARAREVTA